MPTAAIATTVLGVLVVGLCLRDVFHTLFHPGGHGSLSAWLCRVTWRAGHRLHRHAAILAGPTAVLLTVAMWLGLMVVGFALVLHPLAPQDLSYGAGSPQGPTWLDALYLSAVSVSTLGLGDVVIQEPQLRWLAPLEALLGFAVLTAAITWITQIYPALSRRRALALDVWTACGDPGDPEGVDLATLRGWATDLAAVNVDLVQNSETYWFQEDDPRLALAPLLEQLDALAGHHPDSNEARHLDRALDVIRDTLRDQYAADAPDWARERR